VPEAAAHQAAKYQQIKQTFHTFRSVLLDVIEDCNNYLQAQHGKWYISNYYKTYLFAVGAGQEGTSVVRAGKELYDQMRLFELDAVHLQS